MFSVRNSSKTSSIPHGSTGSLDHDQTVHLTFQGNTTRQMSISSANLQNVLHPHLFGVDPRPASPTTLDPSHRQHKTLAREKKPPPRFLQFWLSRDGAFYLSLFCNIKAANARYKPSVFFRQPQFAIAPPRRSIDSSVPLLLHHIYGMLDVPQRGRFPNTTSFQRFRSGALHLQVAGFGLVKAKLPLQRG